MNPRKKTNAEKIDDDAMDPFRDPRTIPGGWDVSAFYAPERENLPYYVMEHNANQSVNLMNTPHEASTDTL
ncbi:MAG TPA: hypothetical protein VLH85_06680 [Levilinea sp.]|nr:hypothetical protein [Levilinea sp.]